MIRAFIAIDLPAGVREKLGVFGRMLQQVQAPVSWVKPGSIHLTLKFLGDILPEQVPEIQAALQAIAADTRPFRLQAQGCGAFPSLKQMRVVWVGLQGDVEPLKRAQQQLESAMVPLGFEREGRPFRPHLTLGRVKGRQHLHALQEVLLANQAFEAEAFDVTELVLYRSELRREGALYTPLFRAPFTGRAA